MKIKFIDISEVTSIPPLRDLTAEELVTVIAEYKATRTAEALDADYADFGKKIAEGVSAEQLLQDLEDASATE
jgi:hypothetical protein